MRRLDFLPGAPSLDKEIGADNRTFRAELWAGLRTVFHGPSGLQPEGTAGWSVLLVNLLLLLLLVSVLAADVAGERTANDLHDQANTTANLQSALLGTELERYRSLPYVLAHDQQVIAALETARQSYDTALGHKLDVLAQETAVHMLWVMSPEGVGIASSTTETGMTYCRRASWVDTTGARRGCRDRYYFTEAMRRGSAEYFALGRAERRAGMYISKAVDTPAGRAGVVVAKVQFDKLEDSWAHAGVPTFVTDSNGVVLISSVKEWRFHTLKPLSPEARAAIKKSAQFGASSLDPMPIAQSQAAGGLWSARIGRGPNRKYVLVSLPMPNSDWTLHVMQPAGAEVASAKLSTAFVVLVSGLLALTIVGIFVRRRARRKVEVAREAAARVELETRVASRTAELTVANDRLRTEMDERRRIARNLNRLQEELVQANKLATLGQITAGVAHELNQPVAAIRAYAANALVLLDRSQEAVARKNLGLIGDMTDRISVITGELRAFSRRSTGQTAPVEVTAAIEGALLLTSHRIAVDGVEVVRSGETAGLVVNADRARLEQVLVNLIQNALDALAAGKGSVLRIEVEGRRDRVLIHVSDNGAGMTEKTFKTLFMPFQTTKANGLGLGLVISHDIVAEFGGDLTAKRLSPGARFTISLRSAA